MSRAIPRHLAIVGLAASLVACKTDATQIIVLVNTDMMVPAEIAGVDIRIETVEEGTLASQSFDLSQHTLPLSFGIQAQPERADDSVRVVVAGVSSSGAIVVLKTARVTFVEEETVLLPMMLARACQGRLCPDGETCIDGDCGSELVASLPAIEPGQELRYDAGPWPGGDGGISPGPDAETSDGGPTPLDGGATDAAQPLDGDVPPDDAGAMSSCLDGCPANQVCTNVMAVRLCAADDDATDCACRQVCAPLDPDVSQCFGGSTEQCALLTGGPTLDFGACLEGDGQGQQGDECTIVKGGAQGCSATSSHVCVASSSAVGSSGLCARLCSMESSAVCGDANDTRCAVQEAGSLGFCVSLASPSTTIGLSCANGNDCDTGYCEPILADSCTAYCNQITDCPMGSTCVQVEQGRNDGVCLPQCQTDADCSGRNPNTICEDVGILLCVPGCTVTGCPNGGSCQLSGRCM